MWDIVNESNLLLFFESGLFSALLKFGFVHYQSSYNGFGVAFVWLKTFQNRGWSLNVKWRSEFIQLFSRFKRKIVRIENVELFSYEVFCRSLSNERNVSKSNHVIFMRGKHWTNYFICLFIGLHWTWSSISKNMFATHLFAKQNTTKKKKPIYFIFYLWSCFARHIKWLHNVQRTVFVWHNFSFKWHDLW